MFSQDQLTADDYATLMKDELDDLAGHRLRALISIEENKKRVAKWYDKKSKGQGVCRWGFGVEVDSTDWD